MIITVYKLWENGVFDSCPMQLNCEELGGQPYRQVWLVLTGCCFPVNFQLTFREPEADQYFLEGVLLTYKGVAIVLDAVSMGAINEACNQCCDPEDVVVAGRYNGELPPFPEPPEMLQYIVLRTDLGNIQALDKFMRDYYGQYSLAHPVNRILYDEGVSTYMFYSDKQPFAIAPDTLQPYDGSFISNIAPEIVAGEWYVLTVQYNGAPLAYPIKAQSMASLADLANALQEYDTKGIWSNLADQQIELSATPAIFASLVITKEDIPDPLTFTSNVAPVLDPEEVFRFVPDLSIGGVTLTGLSTFYNTSLTDMLGDIQADPVLGQLGLWSLINLDTQLRLQTTLVDDANLVIDAYTFSPIESNTAPALDGGEWYILDLLQDGTPIGYPVKADTLQHIVDMLPWANGFTNMGIYEVVGSKIVMHPLQVLEGVGLEITKETIPAPNTITSPPVPVPGPGEHINFAAQFDLDDTQVIAGPTLNVADFAALLTELQTNELYSNLGTWTGVNTDTQVQLESSYVDTGHFAMVAEPD